MNDDTEMMPFYIAANAALRQRAEAAEQRAEAAEAALAQARADRALMTGLWLGAVAPRVLPAILPTDPGDRERLVAALDAVNLQPSAEACIAAGRAVIARIVLREAVPDIEAGEHVGAAGTAP